MHVSIQDDGVDRVRAKVLGDDPKMAFVDVHLDEEIFDAYSAKYFRQLGTVFIGLNVAREIAKAVEVYDQGLAHDEAEPKVSSIGDQMRVQYPHD